MVFGLGALGIVSAFGLRVILPTLSSQPAYDEALVAERYRLPITAPRDQGGSDLCWVFATLSMLETNYRVRHPGADLEFSRGALQRLAIADRLHRSLSGEPPHGGDAGLAIEALALIRANGLIAAADFHDFIDSTPIYGEVGLKLASLGNAGSQRETIEAALDPTPPLTHLDGAAVTPKALAKAVLGEAQWVEYDVATDGVERIGPSKDPDARRDTLVHYAPREKLIEMIRRSLKRGESVVWGNVDHAMLIYGADYAADGRALGYWVKDSAPARAERMSAEELHRQLTDITVTVAPSEASQTATN